MYNAQLRQLRIQAQRLLMEDRNFLHTNPKNSHNSWYKPEYRIYARLFSTIAPRRNYDDKTLGNNFHQAMDYTQAKVPHLPSQYKQNARGRLLAFQPDQPVSCARETTKHLSFPVHVRYRTGSYYRSCLLHLPDGCYTIL